MFEVETKQSGDLPGTKTFVNTLMCKKIASLRMLISHQFVLRNVHQQEDHADLLVKEVLSQLVNGRTINFRSAEIFVSYPSCFFFNWRPYDLSLPPVARVIKNQQVGKVVIYKVLNQVNCMIDFILIQRESSDLLVLKIAGI